ncbi:histidine phosphatase family protein [Tenacibaculum sp. 1B UA]|uniref:SixA phosphatase family protein n=1 Tax=unclassified Tenacibaculum TaxID=2635139 RepID=UPI0026E3FA0F|nr:MULTISPECIES: phosphoglycerate mutase family protein [unclassified Tenacibaculum]MDO6675683.1 phosphoglycerate mutase family protein [Tenacibaculum sp. 1_MG-2023]MDX8554123.1 histidine phosphatase family protein [Tenacibaculum sp. 1B UA]
MKKYLLGCILAFSTLISCSQKEVNTTYYLIRHAEKDRTDQKNKNPNLNDIGQQRAEKWKKYFEDIHLDAIYSTNYNRTIQTATPVAKSKKLEITIYDPNKVYDDNFKKNTKGKSVLIVGHSNTTPSFANKILNIKKYEQMDENDNSSVFVISVKISSDKKEVSSKRLTID